MVHVKKILEQGCRIKQDSDPSYCPSHGEYLAISVLGRKTSCIACTQERIQRECDAQLQELAAERRQARRAVLVADACIPARFKDASFASWTVRTERQQQILSSAQLYAETFSQRLTDGGGLIFCGNAGTGKTSLAIAILHDILAQGFSGKYMSVVSATAMLKDAWRKPNITESDVLEVLQRPDLLILDEAGVQFETDVEVQSIYKIVNARYEACRPIIFTSNDALEEMEATMGERVIDRMRENGKGFSFNWESFRKAGHA